MGKTQMPKLYQQCKNNWETAAKKERQWNSYDGF